MKYETLSEYKTGTWSTGDTITFTFTFINNIDHISFLYTSQYIAGYGYGDVGIISTKTILNNTLTIEIYCRQLSVSSAAYKILLLATVASY